MQRAVDEAKLAAIKLRTWTDKGIYSRLFDRHTNIRTDNNWLFFNVEGLSSDAHLETAMSMLIANAIAERASGKSGQPSITVLDECWSLLDSPCSLRKSCNCFGRRASGTPASGAFPRRSKTLLEPRRSRASTVRES